MAPASTPTTTTGPAASGRGVGPCGESFAEELQVRAAEASTQVQAAELLGEELQASIASSDLADLRALALRNDVALDEVVLEPEQQNG